MQCNIAYGSPVMPVMLVNDFCLGCLWQEVSSQRLCAPREEQDSDSGVWIC